jgi:DNA-binding Lrp family transcriptional regulator
MDANFRVFTQKRSRRAMPQSRPAVLDAFDRAILALLQVDTRTPLRRIGEQVHLSTAATQRRIRRLEEQGVIQAHTAVLDPASVGQAITLLVEVQAERTHGADLDAMKAAFSGPEIQQCYYVTGHADFMLVLTVATMADYEGLARRLFHENRNVKWFKTTVVMDRVKVGLAVPLLEP